MSRIMLLFGCMLLYLHVQSMPHNSVPCVAECWKYGYCTKKEIIHLQSQNETMKEPYHWKRISFEKAGMHIIMWRKVSMYESRGYYISTDTLQVVNDNVGFIECSSKSPQVVNITDTMIEILRGYSRIASYPNSGNCILEKGIYPTYGNFFCIPAQVGSQEKSLYLFTLNPYEYVTDLGLYGIRDNICYGMKQDGTMIAVLSRDASIKILKIDPCLQPYSMLRHNRISRLKDFSLYFI